MKVISKAMTAYCRMDLPMAIFLKVRLELLTGAAGYIPPEPL
jgi:hypothetical protein